MIKKTSIQILFITIFLISCLMTSGCSPAEEYPLSPTAIENHFGDSMEEVTKGLDIDLETAEVKEISDKQTDVMISDVPIADDQNAFVTVSFYDDVFSYVKYLSFDPGFIYDQAEALYNSYTEKYGEEITDPSWQYRKANITKEDFMNCENEPRFTANWNFENDNISNAMFDGQEIKLIMEATSIVDAGGEDTADLKLTFRPLSEMP